MGKRRRKGRKTGGGRADGISVVSRGGDGQQPPQGRGKRRIAHNDEGHGGGGRPAHAPAPQARPEEPPERHNRTYEPGDGVPAAGEGSPSIMLVPLSPQTIARLYSAATAEGGRGTVSIPLPSIPPRGERPFRVVLVRSVDGKPGMMSVACDPIGYASGDAPEVWEEASRDCPVAEQGFMRLFGGGRACVMRVGNMRKLPRAISSVTFGAPRVSAPYMSIGLPDRYVSTDSESVYRRPAYDPLIRWDEMAGEGWDDELVREFLPEPYMDAAAPGQAAPRRGKRGSGGSHAGMAWDRWLVGVMDMSLDVADAKIASAERARREREDKARIAAVERELTKEKVTEAMRGIRVTRLDDDAELVRRALDSEREILERHHRRTAGVDTADDRTVARWVVNYIRHELTEYDEFLYSMRGSAGFKSEQYYRYQHAVLSAISMTYPKYSAECRRQLKRGGAF